jgi:hypothetical protein
VFERSAGTGAPPLQENEIALLFFLVTRLCPVTQIQRLCLAIKPLTLIPKTKRYNLIIKTFNL